MSPASGPLIVTTSLPLRWSDTDALGHIYHGTQISLIEEARTLWLNQATGGSGLWMHVVARIAIDYRSPLSITDVSACLTCVGTGFGRSSVRTRETIASPAGVLVAEAESVVVAWDERAGRSRALSQPELDALQIAVSEATQERAR